MLVNAECYLAASKQPLSGGRDFLESLVIAVSGYAQEFLSRVHHPEAYKNSSGLVQLQKIDNNRHRLIVHSQTRDQGFDVDSTSPQPQQYGGGNLRATSAASRQFPQLGGQGGLGVPFGNEGQGGERPLHGTDCSIQIDLTTVQLFDLVEAVDQFFADSQTLPDLSLQLTPVPKHFAGSSQPLVKQAVPGAVGVSSLALAAIAFFFVPIPEVQRPTEPKPQSNSGQSSNLLSRDSGSAPGNVSSTPPAQTSVSDLEAAVATAPQITDSSQIDALNQKLYNQVNQAWKTRSTVEQDLIYRVGVTANGSIVGYKSVNAAASDAIEQTPLPNLLYNPAASPPASQQPLAQFRVVFTDNGVLQVSPWLGRKR
jgi:cytoskeletal protein RodZ